MALQHYMQVRENYIKRANEKVKEKGIEEGNLVLRYNRGFDKSMHKRFRLSGSVCSRWFNSSLMGPSSLQI